MLNAIFCSPSFVSYTFLFTGKRGCGAPSGRRPETKENHQKEKTSMSFFLHVLQTQMVESRTGQSVIQKLRFFVLLFKPSVHVIVRIAALNHELGGEITFALFFLLSCFVPVYLFQVVSFRIKKTLTKPPKSSQVCMNFPVKLHFVSLLDKPYIFILPGILHVYCTPPPLNCKFLLVVHILFVCSLLGV